MLDAGAVIRRGVPVLVCVVLGVAACGGEAGGGGATPGVAAVAMLAVVLAPALVVWAA